MAGGVNCVKSVGVSRPRIAGPTRRADVAGIRKTYLQMADSRH
jgi:hypothetical protein